MAVNCLELPIDPALAAESFEFKVVQRDSHCHGKLYAHARGVEVLSTGSLGGSISLQGKVRSPACLGMTRRAIILEASWNPSEIVKEIGRAHV